MLNKCATSEILGGRRCQQTETAATSCLHLALTQSNAAGKLKAGGEKN